MNILRKKIDLFCRKHPGFGIPRLMLSICIATAIVYIISLIDQSGTFCYYLSFSPSNIIHGQIWRLISWILLPDTGSIWLLISLYFYYFIGSTLENAWGIGHFTIYYLLGVAISDIISFLVYFITGTSFTLDPYYLNMSMFFAFATLYPEQRVLLFFVIPIKVKWLALADAALILIPAIINAFTGNWHILLLPLAAVLNYFIYCGPELSYMLHRSKAGNKNNVIHFKKETAQARKAQSARNSEGYRHKCSVCGRTDKDYPGLEFRYCSRCAGYHCFCSEHINNHIHFTE